MKKTIGNPNQRSQTMSGANPLINTQRFYLPSKMKMVGCRELFVEFPIDPHQARLVVPPSYDLHREPDGKAVLLIMIQEWERCILDGVLPLKNVRMSHLWIELSGPEEIGPFLPGTDASLPTQYYYALPHQIDNQLAVWAFKIAGIDVQLVKRIEASGEPGEHQIIRVVESENPGVGYSWETDGALWSTPKIVTGRRWFYRNYGQKLQRKSAGLVVCRSTFLGDSPVVMTVDRGSMLDRFDLSGELPGKLQYVTTECVCKIRVGRG